jgi:hypothetical protein
MDSHAYGKKLAAIAKAEGCTVEEAFQRVTDLYIAIQLGVWQKGYLLGVVDSDGNIHGIVAAKDGPESTDLDDDPNFEIDL